jgi:hypothetical protein
MSLWNYYFCFKAIEIKATFWFCCGTDDTFTLSVTCHMSRDDGRAVDENVEEEEGVAQLVLASWILVGR